MRNHKRKWLQEDVINLIELVYEGQSWRKIAFELGRSENACKIRYGMVRFAGRMIGTSVTYSNKIIYKPIKESDHATNGQNIL